MQEARSAVKAYGNGKQLSFKAFVTMLCCKPWSSLLPAEISDEVLMLSAAARAESSSKKMSRTNTVGKTSLQKANNILAGVRLGFGAEGNPAARKKAPTKKGRAAAQQHAEHPIRALYRSHTQRENQREDEALRLEEATPCARYDLPSELVT